MSIKKFDNMGDVPMVFKNRPNIAHKTVSGEEVWDSRSVAVSGVVLAWKVNDIFPHVLVSKRGPNAADFKGKWNTVCGYLDKNESGTEAFIREAWEEVGINLVKIMKTKDEVIEHMEQPWFVNHYPTENRENVTLRFGLCFSIQRTDELPKLTTKYNEVVGEVEDPSWIKFEDLDNYEWAFNHDKVIKSYLDLILKTN